MVFVRKWNFDGAARQLSTSDLEQIMDPTSDMGEAIALALEGVSVTGNLPSGGLMGMLLAKASNIDGDVEWVTPSEGGGDSLPSGGTANQVLGKDSSTEGDASWRTLAAGYISYAGSTNLVAANVEAALDELDTEKAASVHTHTQASVTDLVGDLAEKSELDHQHVASDVTDIDMTTILGSEQGFYSVKYNTGTSSYPNRSTSGTVDPQQLVWWIGGPGPSKSGAGSTGAVTGDFYVATP